jgi:hypothetical protein
MKICKDKITRTFFIYPHEQGDDRALMISPKGDVDAMDCYLFTDPVVINDDENSLISIGQITGKQFDIYRQYIQ